MNNKIRSFIAIELSDKIIQALRDIEDSLKEKLSSIKWVKPENIHLTIKFLGNIEPETVENIKNILNNTALNTRMFKIKLSKIGVFPDISRPRVLWVGLSDGFNETVDIFNKLEGKLPFHPHLTLARIKSLKEKDKFKKEVESKTVPEIEMAVKKITLFRSKLSPKGPTYTVLHEAYFQPG
ncbi:MAG: RNA 2',3'-cyclic phosphodiesterase [Candidatus Omnitrophota bacterium]|nr:RNA 2',3'-cyclic phosphodiesterase [Candidatus Omnitrophota bacterium]